MDDPNPYASPEAVPLSEPSRDYTRQPLWVVALCCAIGAALGIYVHATRDESTALVNDLFFGTVVGGLAGFVLWMRSFARTASTANLVLWGGIVMAAVEFSLAVAFLF